MKQISIFILLYFIVIATVCKAQFTETELNVIKDSIKLEIADTSKSKWVKDELIMMQKVLAKPDSLFPYSKFDSVIVYQYSRKGRFEPAEWNTIFREYIVSKNRLEATQVDTILKVVNNPLHFYWWECGTPFIECSILFFHKGKEIATIDCACSGEQLFFKPNNILGRYGVLNEKGFLLFHNNLNK